MRRWRDYRSAFVLGHRGARHNLPENTIIAFDGARLEGAEGTEFDVRLSSDHVPFVVHDSNLRRVTDGRDPRVVRELTSHELDRVRLTGDQPIPRLAEVLDWARKHEMLLNIELKSDGPLADPIADVVSTMLMAIDGATEWALASSFHPSLLKRLSASAPELPLAFLASAAHPAWCDPEWVRSLGATWLHPEARLLLDRPDIARLNDQLAINTWTVNHPDEAKALKQLGVLAVISDHPAALTSALK